MNVRKNYNYFLKRVFSKGSTGVILFLHLAVIISFFIVIALSAGESKGFLGTQKVEINETVGGRVEGCIKGINPKISNANNFFACVFPNLILLPVLTLTYVF